MTLKELNHNLWNIGFVESCPTEIIHNNKLNIHWVKKKFRDRWFADPFILNVTEEEIIVLVEEFCYDIQRGRIARLVINKLTYEEKYYDIILDLPTHLSFPFIFKKDERIYVMPENSASGALSIYEYDDGLNLTHIGQVANIPLTDATIFFSNGQYYLCGTSLPEPNGNRLLIYEFDDTDMKIGALVNTICLPSCSARNAGSCFHFGEKLYRPAQDCNGGYGKGVIIQELSFENKKPNKVIDICRFLPKSFKYDQGLHTFNSFNDLVVVDGRGLRHPFWGRPIRFFANTINKLRKK